MYNKNDINLTKAILKEELKIDIDDNKLLEKTKKILKITYSIGGDFGEGTIRKVVKTCIEESII
ncbi:hypothetical protein [Haliovirga abyssi]|uniref:Uncharacterized protein n=1 Tax=Haliovirga abyssi TaxID=2996794 RepID=A0AAU9DJ79_9FUSO|nr:hypothetical protein [Haliovirga abyssi]BDU51682.1 hypothetical protein HLVA_22510 [Haliovirga abyssi]